MSGHSPIDPSFVRVSFGVFGLMWAMVAAVSFAGTAPSWPVAPCWAILAIVAAVSCLVMAVRYTRDWLVITTAIEVIIATARGAGYLAAATDLPSSAGLWVYTLVAVKAGLIYMLLRSHLT